MKRETRHEKLLMREWDKFQREFRELRALQAVQIEHLYAAYKPSLDNYSFMVSMERQADLSAPEDADPETYEGKLAQ